MATPGETDHGGPDAPPGEGRSWRPRPAVLLLVAGLVAVATAVALVARSGGSTSPIRPPAVTAIGATAEHNLVTVRWATTRPCARDCRTYVFGPARYDDTGRPLGDVGEVPSRGAVSFRVPTGGRYRYVLQVEGDGARHHVEEVVEVAAPPVPDPDGAVEVDLLDLRDLADDETAATVRWSHPGGGEVEVRSPSGKVLLTRPAGDGTAPLTAGQVRDGRSAPETGWGPFTSVFGLRYCEPATGPAPSHGPADLPLCSDEARVHVIEATSRFDQGRLLAPPGEPVTVRWADDADEWSVRIPSIDLERRVTEPRLTLEAGALAPGSHEVLVTACRTTPGTDPACTDEVPVRSPADGTVTAAAAPAGTVERGAVLAGIDTDGDGAPDVEVEAPESGTVVDPVPVTVGQEVAAGAVLATIRTALPASEVFEGATGTVYGNANRLRIQVGPQATWTHRSWRDDFTSGDEDQHPLWKEPTTGLPIDLVVDDAGEVWSIGEYQQAIGHIGPEGVRAHEVPLARVWRDEPPAEDPAGALGWRGRLQEQTRPFGVNFPPYEDVTATSAWGESITLDDQGRVYAAQGGAPFSQVDGNHSRIVRYDPAVPDDPATLHDDAMCVVNLPETRNSVSGLAWDPGRGRLWVAEFRRGGGGSVLSSFDPDALRCENDLDYSDPAAVADSAHRYCAESGDDEACLTKEVLTEVRHIAHVAVDPSDGSIWFTEYEGGLGRHDPATGTTTRYPAAVPGRPNIVFGSGAWQLRVTDRWVYFNEFFDADLVRFDRTRHLDPTCTQPVEEQPEPCMEELHLPMAHLTQNVHSIEVDGDRLWFTIGGGGVVPGSGGFGVVDLTAWEEGRPAGTIYGDIDDLAPPARAGVAPGELTAIDVDPTTGDLVVGDFLRRQIVRLRPR